MKTFIRNALAALVVATAGVAASAPAANAGGIGFELSIGGPGGGIVVRDHRRHGGWDRFEGRRGFCQPFKAVRKAGRMGVHRAEIIRAGHRRVVVEGFRHHRPVRVVFANESHCPVIGVHR